MSVANVIKKGLYKNETTENFLYPKQYIIIEKNEKNYLLLRFENKCNFKVDKFTFLVKQFNNLGEVIQETRHAMNLKTPINNGELKVYNKGILLLEGCVNYIVKIDKVYSDSYIYTLNKNEISVFFNSKNNDDIVHLESSQILNVKRIYNKTFKKVKVFSIIIVILFFLICFLMCFDDLNFFS